MAGFLPLFVAWKVEGGNEARVGGAFLIDFVLAILVFVGLAALSLRFNKREKEAL
jgi:hypothetical protein